MAHASAYATQRTLSVLDWEMRMNLPSGLNGLYVVPFFPDSAYLANRWWHRLATVILWIWLIWATWLALHALWEQFEYARTEGSNLVPSESAIVCVLWLLTLLVPIVVYRVILFVCIGSAWKEVVSSASANETVSTRPQGVETAIWNPAILKLQSGLQRIYVVLAALWGVFWLVAGLVMFSERADMPLRVMGVMLGGISTSPLVYLALVGVTKVVGWVAAGFTTESAR